MRNKSTAILWLFFGLLLGVLSLPSSVTATALDDYVQSPDEAFSYSRYHRIDGVFYQVDFLQLNSLNWRSSSEVDRTLWQHEVLIYIPLSMLGNDPQTVILLINGGDNSGSPSTEADNNFILASMALGKIVVDLRQIPNQPLSFVGDTPGGRREDALLAYGMDRALDSGEADWAVHFPMAKAVVAAMDALDAYLQAESIASVADYILVGGSKRGWAAWLTAAVDERISAVVPASIDLLNLTEQFRHHWEVYGFYAPAIGDYAAFDLPCRMSTPEGQALLDSIDPYRYRDRYADLPKLILNASGDQFFVPDSAQFYYDDLPGARWLRYTPNVDHGQNLDVILAGIDWAVGIADGASPPSYTWTVEGDDVLAVSSDTPPTAVRLWQASNPAARDFRLETLGAAWTDTPVDASPDGRYRAQLLPPQQGWRGYFIELEFPALSGLETQFYTTEVFVTPDSLPYAGSHCGLFRDGFD